MLLDGGVPGGVTIGSIVTSTTQVTNVVQVDHTVEDGENRVLVFTLAWRRDQHQASTTAYYDGIAMTLIGKRCDDGGDEACADMYILVNPPVGTHRFSIYFDSPPPYYNTLVHAGAVNLYNVDPADPIVDSAEGTGWGNWTVTLSGTSSGDLGLDTFATDWEIMGTPGEGQVFQWQRTSCYPGWCMSGSTTTKWATGDTVTMTRTMDWWFEYGSVAAAFRAAAPDPGFNPQPQLPDPAHPHAVAEVQRPGGTDTYTYDASGSQTQRTEAGTTYNQTVDGAGRLVSVQNTSSGETWTFAYDGDGNRIRQVNPDGTSTLFLAGGLFEVTLNAAGQQTAVKRYYSVGGQTIALRDAGGTLYLLTDHLGSVLAVLDASGAVVGEQRYRPFGQPRLMPGITQTDRGFTGQQDLSAAGLQDFNARWFDTSLGMFASPDSLITDPFDPQGLSRYGYVFSNPLRYSDPSGHRPCEYDLDSCRPAPAPLALRGRTVYGLGSQSAREAQAFESRIEVPQTFIPMPLQVPTPPLTETPPAELDLQHTGLTPSATPPAPGMGPIGCPTLLPGQQCGQLQEIASWGIVVDPSAIDWIDLAVDVFGLVGETLKNVPIYGLFVWGASEVPEVLTLGKSWDELDLGNPASALIDLGSALAESSKILPAAGFFGNLGSIGLNLGGALTLQAGPTYVIGSPQ